MYFFINYRFQQIKTGGENKRLHPGQRILFFETQKRAGTLRKHIYSFRTISKPSEGLYREKGSRFLAFAYPVAGQDEIKGYVSLLEKKYFDARHHCFAWMLGAQGEYFRAFDDGEPSHSAGDPILGQIRSKGVTNVLVVVVRYFGGVKLGVGGLVSAYKTAAADALNRAEIVEKEVVESIIINYDYSATAEVMRLVKQFAMKIQSQRFETECEMVAEYRMGEKDNILEMLDLIKAGGVRVGYHQ